MYANSVRSTYLVLLDLLVSGLAPSTLRGPPSAERGGKEGGNATITAVVRRSDDTRAALAYIP